jgi:hypothetical protein
MRQAGFRLSNSSIPVENQDGFMKNGRNSYNILNFTRLDQPYMPKPGGGTSEEGRDKEMVVLQIKKKTTGGAVVLFKRGI